MEPDEKIACYATVARPIIREYFSERSCIAATRITVEVLRAVGLQAEPFPCRVMIFNTAFMRRAAVNGGVADARYTLDGKSWSIGIGYGVPEGETPDYDGHLVTMVDNRVMVDASINQADRPQKNLILPPVLVADTVREFRRGRGKLAVTTPTAYLSYDPQPKARRYLQAPDWIGADGRHRAAIAKILAHFPLTPLVLP